MSIDLIHSSESVNLRGTAGTGDGLDGVATSSVAGDAVRGREASLAEPHRTIIEPSSGWQPLDLAELWRFRELIWILTLRDIKVRYKQTLLGVAWAVIQPLFTMLVFSVFFGYLAGIGNRLENGIPYSISTFCALLPWQLFANALNNAGNSLVGSQNLITKVFFPRLIIPLSAVLSGLIDFAVGLCILLGLMLWYGIVPGWQVVTLPLFIGLAFGAALAVGLWLSALNVEYRDIRYVIPFLTQFWMFLSPIAYPSSLVREQSEWLYTLYGLNPLTGVIEGFRWALLGKAQAPGIMLLVSVGVVALLLLGGMLYFRRMEKHFADVV